jgi:hypothetical protein
MHIRQNKKYTILFIVLLIAISGCLQAKVLTVNPFLKSAVLPGWGQVNQGHPYGYAMLTGEVILWSSYIYNKNEETIKHRESYEYALKFAHINQGHYSSDYYRNLSKYSSSGFDAGGYNAMVRQTAIDMFQADPIAQQAYINENMIPDSKSWTWDTGSDRKKYSSMRKDILVIKDRVQIMTGLIIANHIFSSIDMLRQRKHWTNVHPSVGYLQDIPTFNVSLDF